MRLRWLVPTLALPLLVRCGGAPPPPPEAAAEPRPPVATSQPSRPKRADAPAVLPKEAALYAALDVRGAALQVPLLAPLLDEGLGDLLTGGEVDLSRPIGFAVVALNKDARSRLDAAVAQAKRAPNGDAFAAARDVVKSLPALGTFRALVPARDRAALAAAVEAILTRKGFKPSAPGVLAQPNVAFRLSGDRRTLAVDVAMGDPVRADAAFADLDRALEAGAAEVPSSEGAQFRAVYTPTALAYVSFIRGIDMIDAALSGEAVAPDQKALIVAAGLGEALQSFATARSREVDVRIGDAPVSIAVRSTPADAATLAALGDELSVVATGTTTSLTAAPAIAKLGEPKAGDALVQAVREAGAMGYPIALPELALAGAGRLLPPPIAKALGDERVTRAGVLVDDASGATIAFALLRAGATAKDAKTLASALAAPTKEAKPTKGKKDEKRPDDAKPAPSFANARVLATPDARMVIVGSSAAARVPRTVTLGQPPPFVYRGDPAPLARALLGRASVPERLLPPEATFTVARDGDVLKMVVTAK